jgi:hypothetical protein
MTTCVNDDSVGDSTGDTCSGYYDVSQICSGAFDTGIFTASERCCTCGGGLSQSYDVYNNSTNSTGKVYDINEFVVGVKGMMIEAGCDKDCIISIFATEGLESINAMAQACGCSDKVTLLQ